MKKHLALTLLCLMPWAATAAADAPPVLETSITLDTTVITPSPKEFVVKTSIKNVSAVDQEITVWSQEGWCWRASDPRVGPDISALQNIPSTYVLHPGQAWLGRVSLFVSGTLPVTFRLGYYPKAIKPISTDPYAPSNDRLIWSNEITLHDK